LKPDNARISAAAYQTNLVPDGSLKCEALFKIEYRSTFSWRFRLPDESTLLDCQMNSAPASPVVKTDGELELSIPAPANSGNFNSLQISITYTARSSKFESVGHYARQGRAPARPRSLKTRGSLVADEQELVPTADRLPVKITLPTVSFELIKLVFRQSFAISCPAIGFHVPN
jgi:hypothetical protein